MSAIGPASIQRPSDGIKGSSRLPLFVPICTRMVSSLGSAVSASFWDHEHASLFGFLITVKTQRAGIIQVHKYLDGLFWQGKQFAGTVEDWKEN